MTICSSQSHIDQVLRFTTMVTLETGINQIIECHNMVESAGRLKSHYFEVSSIRKYA